VSVKHTPGPWLVLPRKKWRVYLFDPTARTCSVLGIVLATGGPHAHLRAFEKYGFKTCAEQRNVITRLASDPPPCQVVEREVKP